MISSRTAGLGMIVIGCSIYLGGLVELFSGQLIFTGNGKHPWFDGFFTFLLGKYAFAGAAFFAFCVASFFVLFGVRLLRKHLRHE
ncbi:hypothetical protein [Uliginosibacterium sp. TH139]|uniref:hypothetical protein n=1 Tax=Uliginosibacterium sp. TH139 TaxID=2067453 RepID=UPI000C7C9E01|nr:hypothetical protein [Uliginosibacterium sp. TH139]PLK50149.1 hypothetical protein C0V76_07020 [Uliginosibacterium sp. TH139]